MKDSILLVLFGYAAIAIGIGVYLALLIVDVYLRLSIAHERTVLAFAGITAALGGALVVLWHVHP